MKKIPMRKCVATNESLPKKELIRIVRTPEGTVEIDESGKRNGRGAYLKRSVEAVEVAMKENRSYVLWNAKFPMRSMRS